MNQEKNIFQRSVQFLKRIFLLKNIGIEPISEMFFFQGYPVLLIYTELSNQQDLD